MTMYAVILLVAALAPPSAKQQYCPPGVELPVPAGTSSSGFFFGGGDWSGGGIRFPDDSVLTATLGSWVGLPEITWSKPFYESETFQSSLFAGTRAGITCEWYLGNGFSASVELGAPFVARGVLNWFPYGGVVLSMGYNAFPGRLLSGWTFHP
jgi:hypothetical protein